MAKKKAEKKGKKPHKNKPTSKKYKMFTIDGDKVKRAPSCPRCGPGIFLMNNDKRQYCGKCHYTEFKTSQTTKATSQESPKTQATSTA